MSKYETTFVIDSLQKSENKENILTKVENFIKNNGGEIGEVEDWGKKRLAYEINRKQYGNYYQIHFEGPGNLPGLLEQEYRLEEGILRFLTITSDPRAALKREEPVEPAKETKEAKVITEDSKSEDKPGENDSSKEETVVEDVKEEVEETKEVEEIKEVEETKEVEE
ncbi:30S ribosomal protein S6, partial [candidate division KSB1 bacterium]|nr:30S ribosomal protein S6 [candidate division KSB1 bacterium]